MNIAYKGLVISNTIQSIDGKPNKRYGIFLSDVKKRIFLHNEDDSPIPWNNNEYDTVNQAKLAIDKNSSRMW